MPHPINASNVCCVSLELSQSKWLCAFAAPGADKPSLQTFSARDVERFVGWLHKLRERAETSLGRPLDVVLCYEAGYDGFWLARRKKAFEWSSLTQRVFFNLGAGVSQRRIGSTQKGWRGYCAPGFRVTHRLRATFAFRPSRRKTQSEYHANAKRLSLSGHVSSAASRVCVPCTALRWRAR